MMADVKLSENSAQWNKAKQIAKHYPSFLLLAILFYRCFLFILQLCCQESRCLSPKVSKASLLQRSHVEVCWGALQSWRPDDPDAWPRAILAGWPCRESAHSSYRLIDRKQRGNCMRSLPSPQNSKAELLAKRCKLSSNRNKDGFPIYKWRRLWWFNVWSGSMSIVHYPKMKKTTLSGSYRTISSYIVSSH